MLSAKKFRYVPTGLASLLHHFKYYHRASTQDASTIWQNPCHGWPRNRTKSPYRVKHLQMNVLKGLKKLKSTRK